MRFSTLPVLVAGVLLTADFALPVNAADEGQSAAAGKIAFNNNCRTCHTTTKGDNRLGPSLAGIVGAKAGTRPGYTAYSQAMKSSGIVWDEQTLDRFIANPEEVVRNNNMKPFKGIPEAAARKSIIQWLKSASE